MVLAPSLSVLLLHTFRWRAKGPHGASSVGASNQAVGSIRKSQGQNTLSLAYRAENQLSFPKFSLGRSFRRSFVTAKLFRGSVNCYLRTNQPVRNAKFNFVPAQSHPLAYEFVGYLCINHLCYWFGTPVITPPLMNRWCVTTPEGSRMYS
jgi:hypothetical protein